MYRRVGLSILLIGASCGSSTGTTPPDATPSVPSVPPAAEPQPAAEAPCPGVATDLEVGEAAFAEQARLDATLTAARSYGAAHAATFGGHGLTWHTDTDASVVVAFTGQLDVHRAALASRVPHPDELIVCQAVLAASEADAIIDDIDAAYRGQYLSIGQRPFGGPVSVDLAPTALAAAADLADRFADRIVVRLGRYSYPVPTEAAACAPTDGPVGHADLEVDVVPPAGPLTPDALGDVAIEARVTNTTGATVTYDRLTGPRAVLLDASGRRVSGDVDRAVPATYFPVDIATGQTATIRFGSTVASCDPAVGYRLPPGEYTLQYRLFSMDGDPLVAGSLPVAID